ncbi:DUF4214 domain-containing protein [Aquihabitans sp. McL0605]|uniref:DUF4214 domain-containing protein n=1 Tax=Aquihabitans sp. McL0605 TaxID=3415671 RepID=UPI003CF0FB5D
MALRRSRSLHLRASGLVAALVASSVLALAAPAASGATAATPVMGAARVSAADLAGYFRSKGKVAHATVSIDVLAGYYVSEGRDEGLAGDIAFAQSIVETGWFTFSSRTPAAFNNFSGLGAVDGGSSAASFASAQLGVRAQIQHLRAYGDASVTTAKLAHPLVDPRFSLVAPKGKAPTWEQFGNGTWASDPGYAAKVLGIYQQILAYAGTTTADWTPFNSSSSVVSQAYGDILARGASAAESSTATSALDAGTMTPSGLIASLVAGEGAVHGQPVARLYLAALGRLPDRGGLQFWTRRHAAGWGLSSLAKEFLASTEYERRYGTPDDAGYVALLYQNVLHRPLDRAGSDFWVRKLALRSMSRRGLLVQFSESNENLKKTAATTEAALVYVGMILRPPDPSVLGWWETKRAGGAPLSDLVDLVYGSTAYLHRFSA